MAIGVAVAAVTILLVVFEGLGTTSALIEVCVFAAGVVGWVVVGRKLDPGNATVDGVRSRRGDVSISQVGPAVRANDVDARGDVTIRQESRET